MDYLKELENKSIYIIREAYKQFGNIAMLCSFGKDSTTMLWLCRKAFFGNIPFPVVHLDTARKFKEMYEFRDKLSKEWGFKLIVAKNEKALKARVSPGKGKFECCTKLKTMALQIALKKYDFKAILLAIRRDEHGIRAKERYFSPRDQKFKWDYKNQPLEIWDQYKQKAVDEHHVRVHPVLHWTERDIWKYVEREKLPVVNLYFAKNGKRYRSLGCECCCTSVSSNAKTISEIVQELETTKISERSGRAQDKERAYMMQKLRHLGYM